MLNYGIIILVTIGFSVLDIITGYIGAVIKGEVSSSKMRSGLLKKALIVVVIAMCALLQFAQGYIDLGVNIPILTVSCAVIIWMEVTSILENVNVLLDGKVSDLIKKILPHKDVLTGQDEKEKEDDK